MKVLWLSPWLRPLARIYCDGLRSHGAEVLLVTSNQHPQKLAPVDWETVVDPRPKTPSTWPEFARLRRTVRQFAPDVVVAELVRDPRWLALAPGTPRVSVIHDHRPHDAHEQRPRWERSLFDRWTDRSDKIMCMSDFVAQDLSSRLRTPIAAVPLTSDVPDCEVPDPAPAAQRRDFVFIGRLNGYKNADVVLRAWQQHTAGDPYRGDVLHLFGAGDSVPTLPAATQWHRGGYDYADLLPVLHRAKGSLALYRVASQSGVQVLSMQYGVMPLVSDQGALPEFQPPQCPPSGVDDVAGVAHTFDQLASPHAAASAGAAAAQRYRDNYANSVATKRVYQLLASVGQSNP